MSQKKILDSEKELIEAEYALQLREDFGNLLLHPITLIFFFCFAMLALVFVTL